MRRPGIGFLCCLLLTGTALAGEFEKQIKSNWLGAWVLTNVEGHSACDGSYTANRINGEFVRGGGGSRFEPGELAKLDKLDIKRSRLDVGLSIFEPILVSHTEGPFTLYSEATCRLEFEVMLPREVVKSKNIAGVEQAMLTVLERYAHLDDAMDSANWNGRERGDYPADYENTLAELRVWRAERTNDAIREQARLARSKTYRMTDRVIGDPDYLDGFAAGVEQAKNLEVDSCPALLAIDLENPPGTPPGAADDAAAERMARGYRDGTLLILGLKMMQRLPDCYVEVPDGMEVASGDSRP